MPKLATWLCLLLCLAIAWPATVKAYSSVTVPVDDPVYRELDKLESFGLIRTMIHGQRPYVRSEIGRLIAEALANYPEFEKKIEESGKGRDAKNFVDGILGDLKRIYHNELVQRGALPGEPGRLDGALLEYVQSDISYLNEPLRAIQPNNGLGGVDSIFQPLVQYREGRHYQKGFNWSFETEHWGRLGKYVALQFQPRFQMQVVQSPLQSDNNVYIQRLNGHFTFGKLDMELGRDSVDWGPSHTGGLALTTNARPLDFVKISSISPFLFPFFFKYLGPFEMSLMVANLGPEQTFSDPWLLAYKISSKRNRYFEFGMSQLFLIGGDGAPSVGFGQGILDFFNWSTSQQRDVKTLQFDLQGWIPPWRGMEIYAQILFSDLTSNAHTLLLDNTSYLGGVYLPRLTLTGNVDLRLEYRRLAPRYSRSMVFTDGLTENQRLLGEPWGPDSQAVLADFHYQLNSKNLLGLGFQYFRRSQNFYQAQGSTVNRVLGLGTENHLIYLARWNYLFNPQLVGHVGVGLDQVLGDGFVSGADRLDAEVEAGFRVYWGPRAQL
jgi:capsule assembly protein Wzi